MSERVKVSVVEFSDRRFYQGQWRDPLTGRKQTKSLGVERPAPEATRKAAEAARKAAVGAAAVLQDELNTGRYCPASKLAWSDFLDRYTREKLDTLAPATKETALTSLDHLARLCHPDKLAKVDGALLSKFAAELRKPQEVIEGDKKILKPGMKETTLAKTLRHVKAGLRWAERTGLMSKAPNIEMPKGQQGQSLARSRPVTTEEYERLLLTVPKARPLDAAGWQRFITLVWLSGLRLGEAVAVSWDQDAPFCVDLGRRVFRIFGESQKSGKDELVPLVPDLAAWLELTPEAERHGPVVRLIDLRTRQPIGQQQVGQVVSRIGRRAGVVTNKADGKYAGCHDLRRGFGTRWARKVMPAVLRRLMRHASISTTMSYYVDLDAADVARELQAQFGVKAAESAAPSNTLGNSGLVLTEGAGIIETRNPLTIEG
jgi:integrase